MTPNHTREVEKIIDEYGYTSAYDIATVGQIVILRHMREEIRQDLSESIGNKSLHGLSKYISSWEIEIKTRLKSLKDSIGYEDKIEDCVSHNDTIDSYSSSSELEKKPKRRNKAKPRTID